MASEWTTCRIGELGAVITGKTPSTRDAGNFNGPYPFITIPDLDGRVYIDSTARTLSQKGGAAISGSLLPAGAVMMSCIATVGKCGITTMPSFTNQQINSVIPNSDVDARYLYYVFTQLGAALDAAGGGGSVYTNVSKSRFSDICVTLPPLPEQRAIAHILGTLDDKIENNRRMSATLEEMARALYRAWFVDFEPVRAKMAGRPSASAPGDLADLFPDRLVPSELGEIPEGWRVGRIANLASIRGGKQLPTSECGATGMYPVFGANGMMGFANRSTHEGFVIAFGRVGAYCGSVHWTYSGAWINNNASAVVPHAYPEYVLEVMLDTDFVTMRTGSAQPFIPNSALASLAVLDPSSEVRRAFCDSVRQALLRRDALAAQSRTLGELRDTLLPTLVSGEVRIAEPERFGEGVM